MVALVLKFIMPICLILLNFTVSNFAGNLTKIEIEHDNSGFSNADWYLERVDITNLGTNRMWFFQCGQWLAKNKGDGQLRRELYARD